MLMCYAANMSNGEIGIPSKSWPVNCKTTIPTRTKLATLRLNPSMRKPFESLPQCWKAVGNLCYPRLRRKRDD